MSDSIPEKSQAGDSFTREEALLSHGRTLSYWLSLSSGRYVVRLILVSFLFIGC